MKSQSTKYLLSNTLTDARTDAVAAKFTAYNRPSDSKDLLKESCFYLEPLKSVLSLPLQLK